MINTATLKSSDIISTTDPLFDLGMLEEMEDDEYVLEMIDIFLWEANKELKEMKQALSAGKYDVVSEKAHKVKSNAGIIEASQLTNVLDTIESLIKKRHNSAELSILVDSALHLYQRIQKGLNSYVSAKGLRG